MGALRPRRPYRHRYSAAHSSSSTYILASLCVPNYQVHNLFHHYVLLAPNQPYSPNAATSVDVSVLVSLLVGRGTDRGASGAAVLRAKVARRCCSLARSSAVASLTYRHSTRHVAREGAHKEQTRTYTGASSVCSPAARWLCKKGISEKLGGRGGV